LAAAAAKKIDMTDLVLDLFTHQHLPRSQSGARVRVEASETVSSSSGMNPTRMQHWPLAQTVLAAPY
jgi:hypothetical protein